MLNLEKIDPAALNLEAINAALAERSLYEFIKQFWSTMAPVEFVDGWHIEAICEHLEAVSRGEIRRLIINIPPKHMKSIAASVAFPAWVWCQKESGPLAGPQVRFSFASYAQRLSIRDSTATRAVISSPLYQSRWSHRFIMNDDQNTKIRFDNDQGGARFATSVRGALTGLGADCLVIDDAHNMVERESATIRQGVIDWFDAAVTSQLNDIRTGAIIVIMQRVHYQDLTGHLLDRGGWTHLCLPARYEPDHFAAFPDDSRTAARELLWPERFPEKELTQLETDLGSYAAAGQLQQRPAPREGGMFKRRWIETVDAVPAGGQTVRGWDLAATEGGAYTAGVKLTKVDGVYYIEDVIRFRGSPKEVETAMTSAASSDGKNVGIDFPQDPGQAGKAQAVHLSKLLAGYNVRSSPESGSKTTRAEAISAQAEAGNLKLVRGPWNQAFLDEAAAFPNSDYMDQVDALSRAFHRLTVQRKRPQVVSGVI